MRDGAGAGPAPERAEQSIARLRAVLVAAMTDLEIRAEAARGAGDTALSGRLLLQSVALGRETLRIHKAAARLFSPARRAAAARGLSALADRAETDLARLRASDDPFAATAALLETFARLDRLPG